MTKLRRRERPVKTKKNKLSGIVLHHNVVWERKVLQIWHNLLGFCESFVLHDHVLFMFGTCLASPRVICNGSKVEDTTFSSTSSLTIPSHIIPNIFPKMSKVWYQLVPLISVPRFAPMLELLPWNPDNSQNPATKINSLIGGKFKIIYAKKGFTFSWRKTWSGSNRCSCIEFLTNSASTMMRRGSCCLAKAAWTSISQYQLVHFQW